MAQHQTTSSSVQGCEKRVFLPAIFHDIAAAGHGIEIAGEADTHLLYMGVAAGDGYAVSDHCRIRLQECLFDNGGRQLDEFLKLSKDRRPVDFLIGFAGKGEIACR